jgi:hypothetical protein
LRKKLQNGGLRAGWVTEGGAAKRGKRPQSGHGSGRVASSVEAGDAVGACSILVPFSAKTKHLEHFVLVAGSLARQKI